MTKEFKAWQCHAKPVILNGRTCGYQNATEFKYLGLLCCNHCGATKHASDLRKKKAFSRPLLSEMR